MAEASEAVYPRTFTMREGDGYTPLLDMHGNLLVIECPGSADFAGILKMGVDTYVEACTHRSRRDETRPRFRHTSRWSRGGMEAAAMRLGARVHSDEHAP